MMPDCYQWMTPAAPAAIAICCCRAHAALLDRPLPAPGRARFAQLVDPAGRVVDEVVAVRIEADLLELQCHGGPGQRQAIDACLTAHGLHEEAATLSDPLWSACARIAHPAALPYVLGARALPAGCDQSMLFREPMILITGPSNAGKSSLLNHLLGHERVLVAAEAGTTRDLVWADVTCHGWRLRCCDSAGLRAGAGALEAAGQRLVAQARARADLVLFLCPPDASAAITAEATDLVIHSKADRWQGPVERPWASPAFHAAADRWLDALVRTILERLRLPVDAAGVAGDRPL